jgi:hypothetical protein
MKKNEMILRLLNDAVIMPSEKNCIKFNNSKLNSLQSYDTAQNYRILHRVDLCLSQHSFKISDDCHI